MLTNKKAKVKTPINNDNPSIVSSNIRILRNIKHYNFTPTLTETQRTKLENLIIHNVSTWADDHTIHDLATLSGQEIEILYDNELIGRKLYKAKKGTCITIPDNKGNQVSLQLNAQDHIHISISKPGLYEPSSYNSIEEIENKLGTNFNYQVSPKYGYLSSHIKDCGMGLKISVLVHLAGLVNTDNFDEIKESYEERGYEFKEFNYKKRLDKSSYYTISSNLNFGVTEENLVSRFADGILKLLDKNNEELLKYNEEHEQQLIDSMHRSFGLLRHARQMGYKEALEHISLVRIGLELGEDIPITLPSLNQLFIGIKDGNVLDYAVQQGIEENRARSEIIQQIINK